jgi:hypothetical protein
MLNFLKKERGVLYRKNKEERISYFKQLTDLATKDKDLFASKYWQMTTKERHEFSDWVIADSQEQKTLKVLINVLENVLISVTHDKNKLK